MEMPEQYGAPGYSRYRQVSALIGFTVLPVLIPLNIVEIPERLQNISAVALLVFMVGVAAFYIQRDRKVQKRIDETGSPLADKEPY